VEGEGAGGLGRGEVFFLEGFLLGFGLFFFFVSGWEGGGGFLFFLWGGGSFWVPLVGGGLFPLCLVGGWVYAVVQRVFLSSLFRPPHSQQAGLAEATATALFPVGAAGGDLKAMC